MRPQSFADHEPSNSMGHGAINNYRRVHGAGRSGTAAKQKRLGVDDDCKHVYSVGPCMQTLENAMAKAADVGSNIVSKLAKSSGVAERDVEAVLKSLGLDQLTDRVERVTGGNINMDKLHGLELSVRYDKTMISK